MKDPTDREVQEAAMRLANHYAKVADGTRELMASDPELRQQLKSVLRQHQDRVAKYVSDYNLEEMR